jgi:hypothetical protein
VVGYGVSTLAAFFGCQSVVKSAPRLSFAPFDVHVVEEVRRLVDADRGTQPGGDDRGVRLHGLIAG